METILEWKTTLFSSKFELYRNGIPAGELGKGNWKRKVSAILNNRKILFDVKGLFKLDVSIVDKSTEACVATIDFNGWTSKAVINYNYRRYNWQFDNFFRTRWSICDESGNHIRYYSGSLSGKIESFTSDEILILTGFFIRNTIRQRSAGIVAAT